MREEKRRTRPPKAQPVSTEVRPHGRRRFKIGIEQISSNSMRSFRMPADENFLCSPYSEMPGQAYCDLFQRIAVFR